MGTEKNISFQFIHKSYSFPQGTPTDDLWPLFSKYPYFHPDFPRWTRRNDHLYELTKLLGGASLDFLKGLLNYDPKRRITARTALQHPYFTR